MITKLAILLSLFVSSLAFIQSNGAFELAAHSIQLYLEGPPASSYRSEQEYRLASLQQNRTTELEVAAPWSRVPPMEPVIVTRVVDGDTIIVRKSGIAEQEVRVRLIGVDTPETVHPRKPVECYGPEASEFLTKLLLPGTQVFLGYEDRTVDTFGRTVAYVVLPEATFNQEGTIFNIELLLVNSAIIYHGFGRAYTKYPFYYFDLFLDAERQAQEAGRGLWSACKES